MAPSRRGWEPRNSGPLRISRSIPWRKKKGVIPAERGSKLAFARAEQRIEGARVGNGRGQEGPLRPAKAASPRETGEVLTRALRSSESPHRLGQTPSLPQTSPAASAASFNVRL